MTKQRRQILSAFAMTVGAAVIAWLVFAFAVPAGRTSPAALQAEIAITPRVKTASSGGKTIGFSELQAARGSANDQRSGIDRWQVIYLDNKRVGYSHTKTEKLSNGSRPIIRTTVDEKMKILRSGDPLQVSVLLTTDESEDGDLLSYQFQIKNPPSAPTLASGRVEGNRLHIDTTIAGSTRQTWIDWEPGVKSPAYVERTLRSTPILPNEIRKVRTISPEFSKIMSVTWAADRLREVKLLDGSRHNLLKVKVTNSLTPEMPLRAYVDSAGEIRKAETELLGKPMATYTVSAQEAMKELSGEAFDIGLASLVLVKPPLKDGHRTTKAVYRIFNPGKDPAKSFPAGPTQQVRKIDDNTVELTVTALPIPALSNRVPGPPEYLKSTSFLQTDDPHVIEQARYGAASRSNPADVAVSMEKYIHRKLAKKNFSTALASAAEVAKRLEGDCTEHAVLLAATLRARGIPSRVAVGLVYVEPAQAFGGHMWTEAWLDGQWIPLDATLGRRGIGAGHLKMADSSLADDAPAPFSAFLPLIEVLGTIKIQVVSSETK